MNTRRAVVTTEADWAEFAQGYTAAAWALALLLGRWRGPADDERWYAITCARYALGG